MDFLSHFFRPGSRTAGKKRDEVEAPAPILESPPPERVILPPAPAIIPRWRLDRESASPRNSSPELPEIPAGEVTLILDDVLPRVPTHALKEGLHDPDLPLNFRARDFRTSITTGRPTVVLSQLSERYPEIFERPTSPAEDLEVPLPAQKVLAQLERARLSAATLASPPPAPALFPAAIPPPSMLKRRPPPEPEPAPVAEFLPGPLPPPPAFVQEREVTPESAPVVATPTAPSAEDLPPVAESAPVEARAASFFVPPPIRLQAGPLRVRPPLLSGPAGIVDDSSPPEPETASEAPAAPPLPEAEAIPPTETPPPPFTPVSVTETLSALEQPPEFLLLEQESLQAIFMTDEELDLPRISELSASLPGITGCMILAGDHLTQGGEKPAGLDAITLRELSQKLSGTIAGFSDRLPAEPNFTLYGGNRALSIFARTELCLCVVHAPRGFLPGVRERLAAVADSLAQGICTHAQQAELPL